ncbi:5-bromo-4-chloroindolyl phosphate hydrolysis family protein [Marinicella sp. S1101]|uniref:5-bromo-4-chloroindolyl phosphate hydrolysis family protein n=1 Tax=Marinicella marina TaxID=2996016 RepID=UPI0022609C32|nr:5-bromo-4-chloroindolyl phosphate hydrolysis family protein [Marinicella marina]MCX7554153.1 5-bromo-4-chloroindolyl phosphate hydrolysis family protein [Marinicella marina]MDJ1141154.1 5-bromo-4-chloroindolyl phosphate hydrolysis family protein [Marinicella marina]
MPVKYREKTQRTLLKFHSTAWLLYLYSMPFLVATFAQLAQGKLIGFLISGGVFFGVLLSAVWMSNGRKNKFHYRQRKFVIKKPFPLMMLSSLTLGACSLLGSWLVAGMGMFESIAYGLAASVGSVLWYGMDEVSASSFGAVKDQDSKEILALSEQSIVNIEQANRHIANRELSAYLTKIIKTSREVVNTLVNHPEKIPQARRFLHSYLGATESVIKRYADTHKLVDDESLEKNFKNVLQNIDSVFEEQNQKLLENQVFDLDVDIEVLNTLMEKQGIN